MEKQQRSEPDVGSCFFNGLPGSVLFVLLAKMLPMRKGSYHHKKFGSGVGDVPQLTTAGGNFSGFQKRSFTISI